MRRVLMGLVTAVLLVTVAGISDVDDVDHVGDAATTVTCIDAPREATTASASPRLRPAPRRRGCEPSTASAHVLIDHLRLTEC